MPTSVIRSRLARPSHVRASPAPVPSCNRRPDQPRTSPVLAGRGPGSNPASRISRSESSSTTASIRAMNAAIGRPGGDRLEELDHRQPRPPVGAAPAPEHPGVGRRRHAGLAQPLVEHAGADLERQPRPRRHPRALRVDHQLPRLGRRPSPRAPPCPSSPCDRAAARHRRRADPQRVEPEDRRPAQLLLHDELRPRQRLRRGSGCRGRTGAWRRPAPRPAAPRRAPRPGARRSPAAARTPPGNRP